MGNPVAPTYYADFSGLEGLKSGVKAKDPNAIRAAAQQFESLFTSMMLKSMREAKLGQGLGDSQESDLYQDMYDQQIALKMAQGKGIRFWNLTTATISGFQLSPTGKDNWGPNQTLNDKDKEVDHDERLRITGVEPGRYDAKVGYRDSRQCFVRNIEIKADAVFSISDKDLKDCSK